MKMIYEGKAKKIYQVENEPEQVVMFYKDDLTAFNALKKGSFAQKGEINCEITFLIFKLLTQAGVKTHIVDKISPNEIKVKKVEIVPLEVVVRNHLAGSLAKKFDKPEGEKLPAPLIEFYYKSDALQDPFVSEDQIVALKLSTYQDFAELKKQAAKINQVLIQLFADCGLRLIDFKIEFGVDKEGQLLLADEITPDSCRLWDIETNEKFDKDRFRRDLGDIDVAYKTVLERLRKAVQV